MPALASLQLQCQTGLCSRQYPRAWLPALAHLVCARDLPHIKRAAQVLQAAGGQLPAQAANLLIPRAPDLPQRQLRALLGSMHSRRHRQSRREGRP